MKAGPHFRLLQEVPAPARPISKGVFKLGGRDVQTARGVLEQRLLGLEIIRFNRLVDDIDTIMQNPLAMQFELSYRLPAVLQH